MKTETKNTHMPGCLCGVDHSDPQMELNGRKYNPVFISAKLGVNPDEARFIVRAVTFFPRLLDALEDVLPIVEYEHPGMGKRIEALLRECKGETK